MTILLATTALLGLLIALAGLVWQVARSDFEAWTPVIVVVLVERAVRVLPPGERDTRREEWSTELRELPSGAVLSRLVKAWDLHRAARKLIRQGPGRGGNSLPFWTRWARSIKAHRADLRLQEWLSGDRESTDRLLSYLFCLVTYEEHGQSVGAVAKALGCNGNTIYAGIQHLEHVLGEQLLCRDTRKSLTRLGSDLARGARPLIWSAFDDHPGRLTLIDRRQVINSVINGFSGYRSEEHRIRLPSVGKAGAQLRLFDPAQLENRPNPGLRLTDPSTADAELAEPTALGEAGPIQQFP